MSARPKGIMLGLMASPDGSPVIGINFSGEMTVVVDPDTAGLLFTQLADVLEHIGYFKDECDSCEGESCATKH